VRAARALEPVGDCLRKHESYDESSDLCRGYAEAAEREDVGVLERELSRRLEGAFGYARLLGGVLSELEPSAHREDFDELRGSCARTLAVDSSRYLLLQAHSCAEDPFAGVRRLLEGWVTARPGIDLGHELLAIDYFGRSLAGFFEDGGMLTLSVTHRRDRTPRPDTNVLFCD
jgi:hypothetical protein